MRNLATEQWLQGMGVPYTYHESVPLSAINMERSLQNQARISDPTTEARVQGLLIALRNGAELPAAIGWKDGETFVLNDGNNRTAAEIRHGLKTIDLYEIKTTPEIRAEITAAANRVLNGDPPTESDQDQHAVNLVEAGRSMSQVAERLQISERRVREAVLIFDAQARANRLGQKLDWSKLTNKSVKLELARFFPDDAVFVSVLGMARRFGLVRDDIRAIRAGLDASHSEAERLDFLSVEARRFDQREKEEKAKKTGKKNRQENPNTMVHAHTGYIVGGHYQRHLSAVLPSYTEADKKSLLLDVERAIRTLEDVTRTIREAM